MGMPLDDRVWCSFLCCLIEAEVRAGQPDGRPYLQDWFPSVGGWAFGSYVLVAQQAVLATDVGWYGLVWYRTIITMVNSVRLLPIGCAGVSGQKSRILCCNFS